MEISAIPIQVFRIKLQAASYSLVGFQDSQSETNFQIGYWLFAYPQLYSYALQINSNNQHSNHRHQFLQTKPQVT